MNRRVGNYDCEKNMKLNGTEHVDTISSLSEKISSENNIEKVIAYSEMLRKTLDDADQHIKRIVNSLNRDAGTQIST